MIDLACDSPSCQLEAHTTSKSGGVDGWFAAFTSGRRINSCSISHLLPALTFADPNAACGHSDCHAPSGADHLYCSEACRDHDRRDLVGMASIFGSTTLTATVETIRARLAMVGSGF